MTIEERKKKVGFHTLGCKVNLYESEAMMGLLKEAGYEIVEEGEEADVYLINTCAVTNEAGRKSRQAVRHLKSLHPNALMVVLGCYTQMEKEIEEKLPEADILLGTANKDKIVTLLEEHFLKKEQEKRSVLHPYFVENIREYHTFDPLSLGDYRGHTRAFLKIEDGCSNFCSYCIIPYVRGPVRSKPLEETVKEAEFLGQRGYQELVLTGIHLGQYGQDNKEYRLVDLIERLHEIDAIKRIHLSSIEINELTEELLSSMKGMDKIIHHFHVPLQSGNNEILRAMRRKYEREEFLEKTIRLRELFSDVSLTTDVIVGFPGETEELFQDSLAFIQKVDFSKVHVFPYSKRNGTKAALMKAQVDKKTKAERSKRLTSLSDQMGERFCQTMIGKEKQVLLEQKIIENGVAYLEGFTENYVKTRIKCQEDLTNQIKKVKIVGADHEFAEGILV